MRFLIDEDLPRSTDSLFRRYGHDAVDVRDVGLRGAADSEIAAYARRNGLRLVTGDFDFSDIRVYPPADCPGIVVVSPDPKGATAQAILGLLEGFLNQGELFEKLPRSLAIIRPEAHTDPKGLRWDQDLDEAAAV